MYYSLNNLLSRNALFNFVIGPRGGGKSFAAKTRCVKRFIEKGEQFVYLRRYQSELDETKDSFFNDILSVGSIPNDKKYKVFGNEYFVDGQVCGYAMDLNTSHKMKSNSFPKVETIMYDEFLIERGRGRYISNEVEAFLGFYETIARTRNVRALFLANATTINNPYFAYFDLRPQWGSKFTMHSSGEIAIELYYDAEFANMKKDTKFGKIIGGTKYGNYLIDNEFLSDNYEFIETMSGPSKCIFILHYKGYNYGVWYLFDSNTINVNKKIDPGCKRKYAFSADEHGPDMQLFANALKSGQIKLLIEMFDKGKVRFGCIQSKAAVLEIMRYI